MKSFDTMGREELLRVAEGPGDRYCGREFTPAESSPSPRAAAPASASPL